MPFLTTPDYLPYIKQEILNQITNSTESYRITVETAAQEEMASYLRSRFDIKAVFMIYPDIPNTNTSILKGQRYISSNTIYEANTDQPILIGQTGWETNWTLYFQRSGMAVMHLVNIVLFHLHNRLNPSQIPESRTIAYENTLGWLRRVSKGEYLPEFPIVIRDDATRESPVRGGSSPPFRARGHGPF